MEVNVIIRMNRPVTLESLLNAHIAQRTHVDSPPLLFSEVVVGVDSECTCFISTSDTNAILTLTKVRT